MSDPQLVRDTSGAAVQALLPLSSVNLAVGAGSGRVALPATTNLVRLASSVDCYVAFGDSSVTASASDMLFPAGAEVFNVNRNDWTHVAAILLAATPGTLTATKMM